MASLEFWEFNRPKKHITQDFGITFKGYFRNRPGGKPIRYYYYPRLRELRIDSNDDIWNICSRFRVERVSRSRFCLTPIPFAFLVEARRAIF